MTECRVETDLNSGSSILYRHVRRCLELHKGFETYPVSAEFFHGRSREKISKSRSQRSRLLFGLDALKMSIPAPWQQAWDGAQPRLEAIRSSLARLPSLPAQPARVGQVDAELLDQELLHLLKEPIAKALGIISVRLTRLTARCRSLMTVDWLGVLNRAGGYTYSSIIIIQILSLGLWSHIWSQTPKLTVFYIEADKPGNRSDSYVTLHGNAEKQFISNRDLY